MRHESSLDCTEAWREDESSNTVEADTCCVHSSMVQNSLALSSIYKRTSNKEYVLIYIEGLWYRWDGRVESPALACRVLVVSLSQTACCRFGNSTITHTHAHPQASNVDFLLYNAQCISNCENYNLMLIFQVSKRQFFFIHGFVDSIACGPYRIARGLQVKQLHHWLCYRHVRTMKNLQSKQNN